MIQASEIKALHIEFSSLCNARCPLCPRNFYGYPYNRGYEETNLTLEKLQKLLSVDFLQQITEILVNGNHGDFVMNPESVEILSWLRSVNPTAHIHVSTNGGARDRLFWQALAKLDIEINFCIDGLDDTHHIYRQDTTYEQVVRNATTYIEAGGWANWIMTRFDHNEHQLEEAERRAHELKFKNFLIRDIGRNTSPIYNREGKRIFIMRSNTGFPEQLTDNFIKYRINQESMTVTKKTQVSCEAFNTRSIFINASGIVKPCCWMDIKTIQPAQFAEMSTADTVNAGIEWFNRVLEQNKVVPLQTCQSKCGI